MYRASHQCDIRTFNRYIGACANRKSNVGACQGRGVVNAVPDHPDAFSLGLQARDLVHFMLRQYFGNHFADAHLSGNRFGSSLIIAGQ